MLQLLGAGQSIYLSDEIMRLKTYPRLNLPSKRLGIGVDDWLWIGVAMLPGLLVQSIILFLVGPFAVVVWAGFIKPRKPRGWLWSVWDYYVRQAFGIKKIFYKAELEPRGRDA